jgi:hypothetical protein
VLDGNKKGALGLLFYLDYPINQPFVTDGKRIPQGVTEPRYLRLMLSTLSHLRLSARLSPAVISLVIFVCAGNAEDFVNPPFFVV